MKKNIFWLIYVIFLLMPAITVWQTSSSSSFSDAQQLSYFLLRLFGLYALVLIALQTLIGACMPFFIRQVGPWMRKFHITQGIVTYLLALLHPVMLSVYEFPDSGFVSTLINILPRFASQMDWYLNIGKVAFVLLTIGFLAGVLRTHPLIINNWRLIHRANYVAFILVLIHSWYLGSDTHTPPYTYLYPLFIAIFIISVGYKYNQYRRLRQNRLSAKQSPKVSQSNQSNQSQ